MNTIYNHYVSTYRPPSASGGKENRKSSPTVYDAMLRINKESPWYLPVRNSQTQGYAVLLKEQARSLHQTISSLGGMQDHAAISGKTPYSSHPHLASVRPGQVLPQDAQPLELEIVELASAQENTGHYLPTAFAGLQAGEYSFTISHRDMRYEFQLSIKAEDTNRSLQDRVAKLINSTGLGIRASVAEDGDYSSLRLLSQNTGRPAYQDVQFQVSDESAQPGVVAYLGMDQTSHMPTDAHIRSQGRDLFFSSNQIQLQGYSLLLGGTTEPGQNLTVGVKDDLSSLADNVGRLLESYNSFMDVAGNGAEPAGRRLGQEMMHIASLYQDGFASLGLSMGRNGILAFHSSTLLQSAQEPDTLRAGTEALQDFAGMLYRKTGQISLNPMEYVDKKVVAYKNPGKTHVSPYAASAYSGMLFNGYC